MLPRTDARGSPTTLRPSPAPRAAMRSPSLNASSSMPSLALQPSSSGSPSLSPPTRGGAPSPTPIPATTSLFDSFLAEHERGEGALGMGMGPGGSQHSSSAASPKGAPGPSLGAPAPAPRVQRRSHQKSEGGGGGRTLAASQSAHTLPSLGAAGRAAAAAAASASPFVLPVPRVESSSSSGGTGVSPSARLRHNKSKLLLSPVGTGSRVPPVLEPNSRAGNVYVSPTYTFVSSGAADGSYHPVFDAAAYALGGPKGTHKHSSSVALPNRSSSSASGDAQDSSASAYASSSSSVDARLHEALSRQLQEQASLERMVRLVREQERLSARAGAHRHDGDGNGDGQGQGRDEAKQNHPDGFTNDGMADELDDSEEDEEEDEEDEEEDDGEDEEDDDSLLGEEDEFDDDDDEFGDQPSDLHLNIHMPHHSHSRHSFRQHHMHHGGAGGGGYEDEQTLSALRVDVSTGRGSGTGAGQGDRVIKFVGRGTSGKGEEKATAGAGVDASIAAAGAGAGAEGVGDSDANGRPPRPSKEEVRIRMKLVRRKRRLAEIKRQSALTSTLELAVPTTTNTTANSSPSNAAAAASAAAGASSSPVRTNSPTRLLPTSPTGSGVVFDPLPLSVYAPVVRAGMRGVAEIFPHNRAMHEGENHRERQAQVERARRDEEARLLALQVKRLERRKAAAAAAQAHRRALRAAGRLAGSMDEEALLAPADGSAATEDGMGLSAKSAKVLRGMRRAQQEAKTAFTIGAGTGSGTGTGTGAGTSRGMHSPTARSGGVSGRGGDSDTLSPMASSQDLSYAPTISPSIAASPAASPSGAQSRSRSESGPSPLLLPSRATASPSLALLSGSVTTMANSGAPTPSPGGPGAPARPHRDQALENLVQAATRSFILQCWLAKRGKQGMGGMQFNMMHVAPTSPTMHGRSQSQGQGQGQGLGQGQGSSAAHSSFGVLDPVLAARYDSAFRSLDVDHAGSIGADVIAQALKRTHGLSLPPGELEALLFKLKLGNGHALSGAMHEGGASNTASSSPKRSRVGREGGGGRGGRSLGQSASLPSLSLSKSPPRGGGGGPTASTASLHASSNTHTTTTSSSSRPIQRAAFVTALSSSSTSEWEALFDMWKARKAAGGAGNGSGEGEGTLLPFLLWIPAYQRLQLLEAAMLISEGHSPFSSAELHPSASAPPAAHHRAQKLLARERAISARVAKMVAAMDVPQGASLTALWEATQREVKHMGVGIVDGSFEGEASAAASAMEALNVGTGFGADAAAFGGPGSVISGYRALVGRQEEDDLFLSDEDEFMQGEGAGGALSPSSGGGGGGAKKAWWGKKYTRPLGEASVSVPPSRRTTLSTEQMGRINAAVAGSGMGMGTNRSSVLSPKHASQQPPSSRLSPLVMPNSGGNTSRQSARNSGRIGSARHTSARGSPSPSTPSTAAGAPGGTTGPPSTSPFHPSKSAVRLAPVLLTGLLPHQSKYKNLHADPSAPSAAAAAHSGSAEEGSSVPGMDSKYTAARVHREREIAAEALAQRAAEAQRERELQARANAEQEREEMELEEEASANSPTASGGGGGGGGGGGHESAWRDLDDEANAGLVERERLRAEAAALEAAELRIKWSSQPVEFRVRISAATEPGEGAHATTDVGVAPPLSPSSAAAAAAGGAPLVLGTTDWLPMSLPSMSALPSDLVCCHFEFRRIGLDDAGNPMVSVLVDSTATEGQGQGQGQMSMAITAPSPLSQEEEDDIRAERAAAARRRANRRSTFGNSLAPPTGLAAMAGGPSPKASLAVPSGRASGGAGTGTGLGLSLHPSLGPSPNDPPMSPASARARARVVEALVSPTPSAVIAEFDPTAVTPRGSVVVVPASAAAAASGSCSEVTVELKRRSDPRRRSSTIAVAGQLVTHTRRGTLPATPSWDFMAALADTPAAAQGGTTSSGEKQTGAPRRLQLAEGERLLSFVLSPPPPNEE